MFDPDAGMPRISQGMVYLGACMIAVIRLARELQVNVWVVPSGKAIKESVGPAYEVRNRVFSKAPEKMPDDQQLCWTRDAMPIFTQLATGVDDSA
jgi:hypothetical protein